MEERERLGYPDFQNPLLIEKRPFGVSWRVPIRFEPK